MTETLSIPAHFNGPPGSANGGYTCGRIAQLVGAEEVEVSLRTPPPLERPLEVVRDGEHVQLRDGDTLVAEGGPAELPGRDGLIGACWTPRESDGDADGWVHPEVVWAALDCPTSAPIANFGEGPPMVLASLTARLGCPVRVGEPHTILSWRLEVDGRKRRAAAALYDSDGIFTCASRALWIELRE